MKPILIASIVLALNHSLLAGEWPGFRGPTGDGLCFERNLPITWSGTDNVTWSVDLPMPGNSSPIVWGDRIYLTGAVEKGAERVLMCFDRANGTMLWHTSVPFSGRETTHDTNPYCSSTPVTDGQRIFVWQGSAGLVAYDMEGKQLWHRDLGLFEHIWGNASSPVLYEDTVILYAGPGPRSQMLCLSKETGQTVWQKELPEPPSNDPKQWKGSWSTPILVEKDGRTELVLSLPRDVVGFSPRTGQEFWRCGGLTDLVYTSAVVGREAIIAMSGYGGAAIGLRRPGPEAKGDITQTHRLWRIERNPQRIGTGVIIGPHLYMVNEPGVAECLVTATGQTVWKERLGSATWGSVIYADTRLYATDSQGTTFVFNADPKFELLAKNSLGPPQLTRATPAFTDGQIFIRTYQKLYCIGARRK